MSRLLRHSAIHPSTDALETLHDGEGSPWSRLRLRLHVQRCATCRAALGQVESECARTAALLSMDTLTPDTEEAWARLGGVTPRLTSRVARWGMPAIVPRLVALAAAVVVVTLVSRSVGSDLVARMYHLAAQDRLSPKRPSAHDREFAQSLAMLEKRGTLHRVSDICCSDRDGEGPADDGVLTVRLEGSRSPVVIMYEDTKHVGRFEPGDVILIVTRPGLSAAAGDPLSRGS
jgi:hypothetical protein